MITPIDTDQQQRVVAEVQRYVDMASQIYRKRFLSVSVIFNLRSRAAGLYHCQYPSRWFGSKQSQIRFNPWLFAKYPDDSWQNTIPHEVAHYISDCLHDLRRIKPHGAEWQNIMRDFGAQPLVRGDYDLTGIPVRKVQRYDYQCDCRVVQLSSYRHHRILRGEQQYRCRDCSMPLILVGAQ